VTYLYLGDWISRQDLARSEGKPGADGRIAAAAALQKRLEAILEGRPPYDVFVRWKPLEEQPMGFHPDVNDGVRLNIRPFMAPPDIGRKGAGVLRDRPGIKWDKDRGRDIESSPWHQVFKGDRINDWHLTLEEKGKARRKR
jgi:hypothetical protein